MKNKTKYIVLMLLISFNIYADKGMTLKEIFLDIIENSTDIKLESLELEEARLEVKEAYSNLWPDVQLNGAFTRNNDEIVAEFEGNEIIMQPATSKTMALNVEQPLMQLRVFDLGKAASENLESVKFSYKNNIENVLLAGAEIYSALIIEKYNLEILKEQERNLQEHLRWAEVSYKAGRIKKSDLLEFSYQKVNCQSNINTAQNSINNMKKSLSILMGKNELTEMINDFGYQITEKEKQSLLNDWLAIAKKNRKDLNSLIKAQQALKFIVSSTRKEAYPSLSAFFDMNYQFEESGFSEDRSSWVAGLSMNWKAYDRGSRNIRIKQYKNSLDKYTFQEKKLRESIEIDINNILNTIDNLNLNIISSDIKVSQAEEIYKIRKKETELGRSTTRDLLDSLILLTDAKLSLKILKIRLKMAWLNLYKSSGVFLQKFNLN